EQIILEEVAVDWMDDNSPKVQSVFHVRVSSPLRQEVELRLPESPLLATANLPRLATTEFTFDEGAPDAAPWRGRTSCPETIPLSLVRWSYQELRFRKTASLNGSVSIQDGRIANLTNLDFRDAIYIRGHKIRHLGAMKASASLQLDQYGEVAYQSHPEW